jgi:hypothetical protein
MTTVPVVVHTRHFHARPRLFKAISKTGNSSGIAVLNLPNPCEKTRKSFRKIGG